MYLRKVKASRNLQKTVKVYTTVEPGTKGVYNGNRILLMIHHEYFFCSSILLDELKKEPIIIIKYRI